MSNPTFDPSSLVPNVFAHGLKDEHPQFSYQFQTLEKQAKEKLTSDAFGYVHGSAGQGLTDENNVNAFKQYSFIPQRLVSFDRTDLSTTLFGKKYPFPIAIAPVGVQTIFHHQGELATASAAQRCDVPYTLSTASATPIEDVAKANGDGDRFYQLYWPSNEHNDITASFLQRAQSSGYSALLVTLDTYILGWRPSDLDHGYNPFLRPDRVGVALCLSDPAFQEYYKNKFGQSVEEDSAKAAQEAASVIFPGKSHSWEDLKFLRNHWKGPIVLKGIQSVSDAEKAVKYGMDGIVVSSHGGRQIDGNVGSLEVLPEIVDAVGSSIEILFDSGVRTGVDAAKALALGAKMILIGRPWVYGLALGGSQGVEHVIKGILTDLELSLRLMGIPSISTKSLNRSLLRKNK